jgi:hypothetical protein
MSDVEWELGKTSSFQVIAYSFVWRLADRCSGPVDKIPAVLLKCKDTM